MFLKNPVRIILSVIFVFVFLENVIVDTSVKIIIGSPCKIEDSRKSPGVCIELQNCTAAVGNLQAGVLPSICSQSVGRSLVCCPINKRISAEKCEQYTMILRENMKPIIHSLLPVEFQMPTGSKNETLQAIKCRNFIQTLIVGGRNSGVGEFSHQVALGYKDRKWRCGGTLISEEFVLTAAHCIETSVGRPLRVLLGDINLSKEVDPSRKIVEISDTIRHPQYKNPLLYNDIALIKLAHKIEISRSILPACLPQPEDRLDHITHSKATGWGALGAFEEQSDILQMTTLNRFGLKDCNNYFIDQPDRSYRFPQGIIRSQLCAGDKKDSKDTCKGDSGGPLTVNKDYPCVHYVIGVTSFGSNFCGYQQPGVYTNVQSYLQWIEDIVWPVELTNKPAIERLSKSE